MASKSNKSSTCKMAGEAEKIARNRAAIDLLLDMITSVRPDQITEDSRQDLTAIHSLLLAIQLRNAKPPKD